MFNTKIFLFLVVATVLSNTSKLIAQATNPSAQILGANGTNPIVTAVPFLSITPDSRSGAMGDAGVAISADANSIYWNAAKLAFAKPRYGVALSYNPWLRNLVGDMSLSYLSGYYRLDDKQAIGLEMRYFDMGSIQFTDNSGNPLINFRPSEFAFGAAYSRKLSENMGVSVTGRFVYSNLSGNFSSGTQQDARPGTTGAADIAWYYRNDKWIKINGQPAMLSFGANISNIGAKISYINAGTADFIPTNLRIGSALEMSLDPEGKNKLTAALDFNKLMVPTTTANSNGRNQTVLAGMFGSFNDAPGGFSEELKELMVSVGAEYCYNNLFFARLGYFGENATKGNRKYFTVGAGFRYNNLGIDVSYLAAQGANSPLGNTLRFTLSLAIDKTAKEKVFKETDSNPQ